MTVATYGSWQSPITTNLLVADTVGLGSICLDGADTYWLESRPQEGGRVVLVKRTADGTTADMTPPPFNVRSRVHEYGGAAYIVDHGAIYCMNFADRQIYRIAPDSAPQRLTPESTRRYGDAVIDQTHNRLIAVCEDHNISGQEPSNMLVSIDLSREDTGTIIASGHDFYSTPRISPDGTQLAWLTWDHPNMPWDGSELWLAPILSDGTLGEKTHVAGSVSESIFQPEWSPDGTLYFLSDRTNFWNFYRVNNDQVEAVYPLAAEFGGPQWLLGTMTYTFASPDRIVCRYIKAGDYYMATLDTASQTLTNLDIPCTDPRSMAANAEKLVYTAASPTLANTIMEYDFASQSLTILRASTNVSIDPDTISVPESIAFPTENGLQAYGYYYPPKNRDYQAPAGTLPPLLVMVHGGPVAHTNNALHLDTQFWTSRGIAVFDINYGGSTAYGREFRQRLIGQWGAVDLQDVINGANYLVKQGLVDPLQLLITGGSAGGYTVLCAMTFAATFTAGTSYFGISDLAVLASDSHKFESHDVDQLVSGGPRNAQVMHDRSPLFYTDRLSRPILFLQGMDDAVVPPNQAQLMVEAMRQRNIPVAAIYFEGEGHGFRKAENITRSFEAELSFYGQICGFIPADAMVPLAIEGVTPAV